jgi:predicted DsbA family dithiol-disulfide isomerase
MGLGMTDATPLRIDIVSDVVCPWCIIGYKQVEKALALQGQNIEAEIWWHPFELNPQMVPEGQDIGEHIKQKYGSTPEQSQSNRQRLAGIGNELGFVFSDTKGRRIYNTFAAHKLLSIAGHEHGWRKQTELKLALFRAYFQDDRDVSDEAVLLDVAESVGLDPAACKAWIADEALTQKVRGEQAHWRDQNITGVPAIIFNQRFMVPGAQSAEVFADVINKVLVKKAS